MKDFVFSWTTYDNKDRYRYITFKGEPDEVTKLFNNPLFSRIVRAVGGIKNVQLEQGIRPTPLVDDKPPEPLVDEGRNNLYSPAFDNFPWYKSSKEESLFETPYINMPENSIDKVTVDLLDVALRLAGYRIDKEALDKMIDIIELLEVKGDATTMSDIMKLITEWNKHKEG